MEFNTGCIMHLGERYALEIAPEGVYFLCKETGATVFGLSTDEFKELARNEDEISKALLPVRHKEGDITSAFSALLSLESASYMCELGQKAAASIHPESPYLRIVSKLPYKPLQLTLEEYSCITWFSNVLKCHQ